MKKPQRQKYVQTIGASKGSIVVIVTEQGPNVYLKTVKEKFIYLTSKQNFEQYYEKFKRQPAKR